MDTMIVRLSCGHRLETRARVTESGEAWYCRACDADRELTEIPEEISHEK